jgi:hypothetical protein
MLADQAILNEEVLALQVGKQSRVEPFEGLWGERLIYRPPVYERIGRFVVDDELIVGRTARVVACPDNQRAMVRYQPLGTADGLFVQRARR